MRLPAWIALAMIAGGGCVPNLVEGRYGCEREACPPGWTCGYDQRCYLTPPDGGAALLTPCEDRSDCQSGACAESWEPMALSGDGYCSPACEEDDDCDAAFEDGGVCIQGACRPVCMQTDECPGDARCLRAGRTGDGFLTPEPVCTQVTNTMADGRRSCTGFVTGSMPSCAPPGWCVYSEATGANGVCGLLCNSNDECIAGGVCRPVLSDASVCLLPCRDEGECGTNLTCAQFGRSSADQFCVPTEWAGMTDVLPGTLADTLPAPMMMTTP